jgi:hypothetical protein
MVEFDPASSNWTNLTENSPLGSFTPPYRSNFGFAAAEGSAFLFGGMISPGERNHHCRNNEPLSSLHSFFLNR